MPNKSLPNKILLETSVQITKFFFDWVYTLTFAKSNVILYSSYFVLYEFKISLIKSCIDFYNLVKITGSPSRAYAAWSQKFQPRELKNILLITSLILKLSNEISERSDNFLDELEAKIIWLIDNFDTNIKSLTGDFGGDPIVKYRINSKEDFEGFLMLYMERPTIPLKRFWDKHKQDLDKLTKEGINHLKNKGFKKIHTRLIEVQKETKNSEKPSINKSIGDAVIAVDQMGRSTLWTLDNSYSPLCPILGKEFIVFSEQTT